MPFQVAIVCGALAQVTGAATTRDVTQSGAVPDDARDDAPAIQAVIDASAAGDTVYLPAGTFLVGRTLHAKTGVAIRGQAQERTILQVSAEAPMDCLDLSGTRNVEVSGLTIDGKGSPNAHHGIFAHGGGGHTIQHVTIQDLGSVNGPVGIQFTGDGPKGTDGVTGCLIADNTIRNVGVKSEWGGGIRFSWGSSQNQVLRNVIDNTGRGGIFANDGSADLVIRGNTVTRSGRKSEKLGIEIWRACDRVVIEDNVIDHWLSIGGAACVAARRNTVRPPAGDTAFIGLEVIGQDVVVTDNLVDGGHQIGLSTSNNANNSRQFCAYNTVRGMIQWAVQIQGDKTGADLLYYYRNKFLATQRGNPEAIYHGADGRGFRFNGNCHNVTLDSNEVLDNKAEGLELGGKDMDRLSFVGNVIRGNAMAAVGGDPGADLEWADNTVAANGDDRTPKSRGFADPKPVADFTCPARAATGSPAEFANTSSAPGGKLAHVLWDFGDGPPSTDVQGRHTYAKAGTYRVILVVWNDKGRGEIRERSVTVGQQ